jgi:hypothetical protein
MHRSALTIAAVVTAAIGGMPAVARASEGWAMNGTYTVTSNGEWAKTNDVFRDEANVRSTWNITSTCSSLMACDGEVTSDQGWSAPLQGRNGEWRVDRVIKGWQPCPDGTATDGHQMFRFYPVDERGRFAVFGSTVLGGEDKTVAPSGGCGINMPLVIAMPLRLNLVG